MVLEREFPPDDRVEKEAFSLSHAGHKVHIACYTRRNLPSLEKKNNYDIFRKPISALIYKSGAAQLVFPFYLNFWRRFINALYNKNQYDAIHIHDLPLTRIGYELKRKHEIRLICDQHEYYSDWIVKTAHYNTIAGRVIKFLSNWKTYERFYLSKADAVITVESPLKDIYVQKVGLPDESVIVIPNTPRKSVFHNKNINQDIIAKYKNRFVLIYIGGLDRLRGLQLAIEAVVEIKQSLPEILLLLIGPKSKYYDIDSIVKEKGIADYFEWIPFQPIGVLPSYIAASDIGFFTPQLNRDEIHRTIATKIYQYIVMGKPVIVTMARMMQELVESNEIGFAVDDQDPREFIERVLEISGNSELRNSIKENTSRLSGRFSWEMTVRPLIDLYNSY